MPAEAHAGGTVKSIAGKDASNELAELAIARVLGAERDAREAVDRARLEVNQIAETARSAARALAQRTERRIRAVVDAFERDVDTRVAAIDAEAQRLDHPQPLGADELDVLQRAVRGLARELTGARP